jgi:excisionase family DNA binding protein
VAPVDTETPIERASTAGREPSRGPVMEQPIRKWHTVAEVAEMLEFGISKTKMLIASGQIRSIKVGGSRRILPEWVDHYVQAAVERDAG